MPVILAIENDERQIAQLTSIVHGLGAELVVAESADHALAALGQRVPDLILTPALLLPKDDTALTARLRELGAAAVHVQMLSIPILAAPESRGRLSRLRKGKEDSVGCAPEVFSGQLLEYLRPLRIFLRTGKRVVKRNTFLLLEVIRLVPTNVGMCGAHDAILHARMTKVRYSWPRVIVSGGESDTLNSPRGFC